VNVDFQEYSGHLQDVLTSRTFAQAENLKRLLQYLGESSLDGQGENLKEYVVGVEAFGKSPQYDPRSDATVRVHAGKLRQRLEQYYIEEGATAPVRIRFPKGSFKLVFERHNVPPSPAGRVIPWKWLTAVFALALCVSLSWIAFHSDRNDPGVWTPELEEIWRPFITGPARTLISFETGLFLHAGGWVFRRFDINDMDEAARSEQLRKVKDALGQTALEADHSYAPFGAVNGAFLLARLLSTRNTQIELRRGMVLTWEDIQENHLIVIGGGKTLPKVNEVLQRGDFSYASGRVINNRPAPGEQREYQSGQEQYGVISMLPGMKDGLRMMIMGMGTAEGEWAAVEYMTQPKYARELVRHLRGSRGHIPSAYQVVIKARFSSQVPVDIQYVLHHDLSRLR
jgi:hypothetical protein